MRSIDCNGVSVTVCWNDGARSWNVSIPDGGPWWKVIGSVGHAHTPIDQQDKMACAMVTKYFKAIGKK